MIVVVVTIIVVVVGAVVVLPTGSKQTSACTSLTLGTIPLRGVNSIVNVFSFTSIPSGKVNSTLSGTAPLTCFGFMVSATCNATLLVLVTTNDTDISLGISELVIVNVIDGVESLAAGSQELAPGELVSSKASYISCPDDADNTKSFLPLVASRGSFSHGVVIAPDVVDSGVIPVVVDPVGGIVVEGGGVDGGLVLVVGGGVDVGCSVVDGVAVVVPPVVVSSVDDGRVVVTPSIQALIAKLVIDASTPGVETFTTITTVLASTDSGNSTSWFGENG